MNTKEKTIKKNFLTGMIKKYFLVYIFTLPFLFITSIIPVFAVSYTPLVPNAFSEVSTGGNLVAFLGQVFNFGIAAAVVLALIMIIWGGIMYMTTDSWTGKDEGKTKIQDALYGLGLALVSYLILYTVNPCLVQFIPSSQPGGCTTSNTFLYPQNKSGIQTTTAEPSNSQSCPGCVDVSSLGCKNPKSCTLNVNLANKLGPALFGKNAQITEGFPSTVPHISTCHDNGTCADINFKDGPSNDLTAISNLYKSIEDAGLKPFYEIKSGSCDAYKQVGITNCIVNASSTANSFHVTM